MNLLDVNWLAVVLAALGGFVVGGIWYGPVMGKSWMAAVGKTEDDLKTSILLKPMVSPSCSHCWRAGPSRIPLQPTR